MRSEIILLNEIVSHEGIHTHCDSEGLIHKKEKLDLELCNSFQYNVCTVFKSAWKNLQAGQLTANYVGSWRGKTRSLPPFLKVRLKKNLPSPPISTSYRI